MSKVIRQIIKNGISTIIFGICYAFISYLNEKSIDVEKILPTMVIYFITMCILYAIVPTIRKIAGYNKKEDN